MWVFCLSCSKTELLCHHTPETTDESTARTRVCVCVTIAGINRCIFINLSISENWNISYSCNTCFLVQWKTVLRDLLCEQTKIITNYVTLPLIGNIFIAFMFLNNVYYGLKNSSKEILWIINWRDLSIYVFSEFFQFSNKMFVIQGRNYE